MLHKVTQSYPNNSEESLIVLQYFLENLTAQVLSLHVQKWLGLL